MTDRSGNKLRTRPFDPARSTRPKQSNVANRRMNETARAVAAAIDGGRL